MTGRIDHLHQEQEVVSELVHLVHGVEYQGEEEHLWQKKARKHCEEGKFEERKGGISFVSF